MVIKFHSRRNVVGSLEYGMLPRLDVSADSTLYNLIVDDDLIVIAIQGNAFSRLVFCHDNKVISA